MSGETILVMTLRLHLWQQNKSGSGHNMIKYFPKCSNFVLQGWPEQVAPELKPFFHCHNELSVGDNCIMWGHRVIILPQGRQQLPDELHVAHFGIERMKSLARRYQVARCGC